jgi:hypothetical protein
MNRVFPHESVGFWQIFRTELLPNPSFSAWHKKGRKNPPRPMKRR